MKHKEIVDSLGTSKEWVGHAKNPGKVSAGYFKNDEKQKSEIYENVSKITWIWK